MSLKSLDPRSLEPFFIKFYFTIHKKVMTEKQSNTIWNILSSVKFTFFLLIILALTSILGTIIPQQESAGQFARELSPGLLKLLNSLQLFDMYHSLWFRLIISFLSLNLVVCSINRFPATLKLFRLKPSPDRSQPFENIHPDRIISVNGPFSFIKNSVLELFQKQYKKYYRKRYRRRQLLLWREGTIIRFRCLSCAF